MVSAIVLINCEKNEINQVAEALVAINGISEVYSIAGRYDLAAVIRVPGNDELAGIVTQHMLQIDGITNTETLIAFRVYSQYDLERMFSIGLG